MPDQIIWYDNGGQPHFIPVNYDPLTRPALDRPIVPGPTSGPVPVPSAPPQVSPSTPPMAPAPSPIDPSEFAAILYDKLIPIGLSTRAQWGGRIIEGPLFAQIGGENVASFVVGFYVPINYWDTATRHVTELYFRGRLAWSTSGGSLMSGLNVGVATSGGAQTVRFNIGTLTQPADAWSVGRFGAERAPAYIPLVTATLENIRLQQFGNLVPFVSVTVEDSAFGTPGDLVAWADAIKALARYDGRSVPDEFETVDVSGGLMALVLGNKITFTDVLNGMRKHKPQWNIRTAEKLYLIEKGLFSLDLTLQRQQLLRKGAQPITIHSADAFDVPREKVAKFLDFERDYEPNNVKISEDTDPIVETDSFETDTYDVPIASTSDVMMAETSFAFYTEQVAREKSEWSGMAHVLGLDVGDCYKWISGGRELFHRVNEIVRKPDFTVDVKGEGFLTCSIGDVVLPAVPTTWNPADSLHITLSNGNLTATYNGVFGGIGVRSVSSVGSGKYYFEGTLGPSGSIQFGVGIVGSFAANIIYISATVNAAGALQVAGSTGYGNIGSLGLGDVACVAVNVTTRRIWFRRGAAGSWNALSGLANDPAAGTGGIDFSALAGPIFAIFAPYFPDNAITANFGASAFAGAVPSGFQPGFGV